MFILTMICRLKSHRKKIMNSKRMPANKRTLMIRLSTDVKRK